MWTLRPLTRCEGVQCVDMNGTYVYKFSGMAATSLVTGTTWTHDEYDEEPGGTPVMNTVSSPSSHTMHWDLLYLALTTLPGSQVSSLPPVKKRPRSQLL